MTPNFYLENVSLATMRIRRDSHQTPGPKELQQQLVSQKVHCSLPALTSKQLFFPFLNIKLSVSCPDLFSLLEHKNLEVRVCPILFPQRQPDYTKTLVK